MWVTAVSTFPGKQLCRAAVGWLTACVLLVPTFRLAIDLNVKIHLFCSSIVGQ